MKRQLNQFLEKFADSTAKIELEESYDMDFLEGNIKFSYYDYIDNRDCYIDLIKIDFIVINSYDMEDVYDIADSVSGELEFTVASYKNYCSNITAIGSVAILENFHFYDSIDNNSSKIQAVKYFLSRTMELFQTIGIGTLLFMSRVLINDIKDDERIELIDELLKIKAIPVYQNSYDVVLARNLDYII